MQIFSKCFVFIREAITKYTMKHLLLAVLLLFNFTVSAQTTVNRPIVCDETKKIADSLVGQEYQEKLRWHGESETGDTKYVLMVNSKTKSWTFIHMNDKVACILGYGEKSFFYESSTRIKTQM